MTGVRWRADTGWEVRCKDCAKAKVSAAWWPLTDEYWRRDSMIRCRACHLAVKRRKSREHHARDPRANRERSRAYYEANRELLLLKGKDRHDRTKAERSAYMKAYRLANLERIKAYQAAYRARNRERLAMLARAYYAEKRAA